MINLEKGDLLTSTPTASPRPLAPAKAGQPVRLFGTTRLDQTLLSSNAATAQECSSAIRAAALAFTENAPQSDEQDPHRHPLPALTGLFYSLSPPGERRGEGVADTVWSLVLVNPVFRSVSRLDCLQKFPRMLLDRISPRQRDRKRRYRLALPESLLNRYQSRTCKSLCMSGQIPIRQPRRFAQPHKLRPPLLAGQGGQNPQPSRVGDDRI
jgi:hypothetical protein